jgi:hypothetical protein
MAVSPCTRFGGLLSLLGLVLCLGSPARGQSPEPSNPQPHIPIHFSQSYGATFPQGQTSKIAGKDFGVISGLLFTGKGRWYFPIDIYTLLSNLPASVLDQANIQNGVTGLIGITDDPMFTLAQGAHWAAYATGGGGISLKEVQITGQGSPCGAGQCIAHGSESSWQPMLDGGAGVIYRIYPGRPFQIFAETRFIDLFTPSGQFPGFNTAGTRLLVPQLGYRF